MRSQEGRNLPRLKGIDSLSVIRENVPTSSRRYNKSPLKPPVPLFFNKKAPLPLCKNRNKKPLR